MSDGIIIIGAGGFGRESVDVVQAIGRSVQGVLDDNPSELNLQRLDAQRVPYLGTVDSWLAGGHAPTHYLVGIGRGSIREFLSRRMDEAGHRAATAVHPSATVGSNSTVGEGSIICAGTRITTNVNVGRHVHLNPNVTIGHDSTLQDFVSVNPAGNISGDCVISTRSLIGVNAAVLQQLTVGQDVVVGAAALVTKDVPDSVVVKGVPGKW